MASEPGMRNAWEPAGDCPDCGLPLVRIAIGRHGSTTLVHYEDLPLLYDLTWTESSSPFGAYASSVRTAATKSRMMHRQILGVDDPAVMGDHVNGDRLDNRRCNLRACTNTENTRNRTRLNKNNSTGVPGVYLRWDKKKWCAAIRVNRRQLHLGKFLTKEEAIAAYRAAAKLHFGEFAPREGLASA